MKFFLLLGVSCIGLCGQGIPYKLQWHRHFELFSGKAAAGNGELWVTTQKYPGPETELTHIGADGSLRSSLKLDFPLKPGEWLAYLSPAVSGDNVGLLASVASGGKNQTFEGAFFVAVRPDGLAPPVRITGQGPQFPDLIGVGDGHFIAAGDQEPLTFIKLTSAGEIVWNRSFSSKLVLPNVSVSKSGKFFVVSQAQKYILLQVFDQEGKVLLAKQIDASQGTVAADPAGGCTVLFHQGFGTESKVYLRAYDAQLRPSLQLETPFTGRAGRTYEIIATPRGHIVAGQTPEWYSGVGKQKLVVMEFDKSGVPLWRKDIDDATQSQLIPFEAGFFIVRRSRWLDIDKYLY